MNQQAHEEELIAKRGSGGGNIPAHPAGQFPGTCIDIIDMGMVLSKKWNKEQRRIVLRFFCGLYAMDEKGKRGPDKEPLELLMIEGRTVPLWVDAWFTLSLDPKANLTKFIQNWRGVPLTEEELDGFNVIRLLHANAFLQLSHNVKPDKTYVNIDTIMSLPRAMKDQAPGVPEGYVRVKDRPPRDGEAPRHEEEEDDDLPFS